MVGAYRTSLYKKSRLTELTNTFIYSIFGCTFIFFAIVINDPVKGLPLLSTRPILSSCPPSSS